MKTKSKIFIHMVLILTVCIFAVNNTIFSCSTYMFEKNDHLIFAHNLDQPGMKVPGYILINKKGVLKKGKTMSELLTKNKENSSDLFWISKYGSVSFNIFGKDLIDGGMNEAGLYIWEMTNVLTRNIKNETIHSLFAPNWMQYVLDNYKNIDEVIGSISNVAPDGMNWHYFIADKKGNCVAIDFINGKAVINIKPDMDIPGLFNRSFGDEKKRLEYFEGFGGQYKISLNNKSVPRIVLAAKMLRDFESGTNAITYTFKTLNAFGRGTKSQWSVVFDVMEGIVYFRTDVSPAIKFFSLRDINYSNKTPLLYLDIDSIKGGDYTNKFSNFTEKENKNLVEKIPFAKALKTSGGLTLKEFNQRWSTHYLPEHLDIQQILTGKWTGDLSVSHRLFKKYYPGLLQNDKLIIDIGLNKNEVVVFVSNLKGQFKRLRGDNISFNGKKFSFTFRLKNSIFNISSKINDNEINGELLIDGLVIANVNLMKNN